MKVWLPSIRSHSGADVFVERLAVLLARAGWEPVVTWHPMSYEVFPWLFRTVPTPKDIDLIHANSWNAFVFSGRGIPLVATAHHCVRGRGYPAWKGRSQALYHDLWISRFEAHSFQLANAVVSGSASAAAEFSESFGLSQRIEVIGHWLDTEHFRPLDLQFNERPRVLWVGNMSLRKGCDLLPGFRRCLDASIELHIVGGLRAQASRMKELGSSVKVWPRLSELDLLNLYRKCDVTVSLSRHEGFGYTALEAMACGRPVVAFNVTGLKDVVADGLTGILRPCGDVPGIAAACKELIDHPARARAMGLAGRERAERHFSAARAADRYLQLYQSAIAAFQRRSNVH